MTDRNVTDVMSDQRVACRLALAAPGRVSEPYVGQHKVDLLDLSSTGARIASFRQFEVGQSIYLTIGTLQAIKCDIRWVKEGEVGVSFERPLHAAVVDHLAAANRGGQ